jgi:hypothetical protein
LSDDVRDCANRLHMITQPIKPAQEQSKWETLFTEPFLVSL